MIDRTNSFAAAEELLKRRSTRKSLVEWARHKGFEPAKHHELIISEIESFLAGDDEVLLLFAPPGSAKSTYVSVLLPSWYLANNPTHSILAATHSVEFAERWGRRIRNDIAVDENVLGVELSEDSKAAARWSLASGGEYYGVGAGTGISGFRANIGVGDDLFGSREDAYSETVRQKRWDWYQDDFSARLKPGAKRILMNTRWHEEDVAGRVLQQIERKEIRGRVISIPAIAEENDALGRKPGEFLWDDPTGYNYASFLRARQRETSPMMWAALYQQRPAPEEGDYFKADWLKPYENSASAGDAEGLRRLGLCGDGRWWRLHGPYCCRYRSRRSHVPIGPVAKANRVRRMDRSFLQPLDGLEARRLGRRERPDQCGCRSCTRQKAARETSLLLSPNLPHPR